MNLRPPVCFLALCLTTLAAHTQPQEVRVHNRQLFDSLAHVFALWCHSSGFAPAGKYTRRDTKKLKDWLRMLNEVYTEGPQEADVLRILGNIPNRKRLDSTEFGLMHEVVFIQYNDFLSVTYRFTCLNGQILARRFELKPLTVRWCADRTYKFYDLDYLEKVYAPILDFPLSSLFDQYLYSSRLSPDVIRSAGIAYPEFHFTLPSDTLPAAANELLESQYYLTQWDHLYRERADPRFVDLVRSGDDRTIRMLLYSPNYFFSVCAMQSLIYLASVGKIQLTPESSKQIDRVRNSRFLIYFQNSDVDYPNKGYSGIGMKDEWFIRQFETAIQKKPE